MPKLALATALALVLASPAWAQEAATASGTFMSPEGMEMGDFTLTQADDGVKLEGTITNVVPGEHGIHFHQVGDCDGSADFESAGPHFNPTEHQHGSENPEGPHAGDLPNVNADGQGNVSLDLSSAAVSLTEGEDGYIFDEDGTALVLHADADDLMTDPSGNSGDRIACAVIEAAAQ